jgi:hypothetical protein
MGHNGYGGMSSGMIGGGLGELDVRDKWAYITNNNSGRSGSTTARISISMQGPLEFPDKLWQKTAKDRLNGGASSTRSRARASQRGSCRFLRGMRFWPKVKVICPWGFEAGFIRPRLPSTPRSPWRVNGRINRQCSHVFSEPIWF